jgi:tetratricopeptide (TPR) repeat protein
MNYVGRYNDDAWYVNAAKYMAGVQSVKKELASYPIGYPILLVPLAKLFPNGINVFRIPSLIMIFALPFLIFYFLRDFFDSDELLIFITMVALNQYSLSLSGAVMSESPYLFFTFITLIFYKRKIFKNDLSIKKIAVFSFLMAWMFYLRSQGVLIYISFLMYYVFTKKHREIMYITFFYLLFIIPLLITVKGFSAGSVMNKYMYEVGVTYSSASILKSAFGNVLYYLKWGLHSGILSLVKNEWSAFLFQQTVVYFIIAMVGFFIVSGFIKKDNLEYLKPIKIYIILYILLHIFWVNVSTRYVIPIFPFLIYYFLFGIKIFKKKVFYVLCAIILALYLNSNMQAIVDAASIQNSSTMRPMNTFKWIKENTDKDAVLLTSHIDRSFLHTGRKALLISFDSSDKFYTNILRNDVDYVVLYSNKYIQQSYLFSHQKVRDLRMRMYLKDNSKYKKIYENKVEDTNIWRVIKSEEYLEAGEIARQGMRFFKEGCIEEAEVKLQEAFDICSAHEIVAVNLSVMYMMKKEYARALHIVEQAINRLPYSAKMMAVRGDIYSATDNSGDALKDYEKALNIAKRTYDSDLIEILSNKLSALKD